MNYTRAKLWHKEINRLLEVYQCLIEKFEFSLMSCNSGRITFQNRDYKLHFIYSYDRYQIDKEMPMSLISFESEEKEENIIEILKRLYPEVDIYNKISELNSKTNDQGLTYLVLMEEYIYSHLELKELFKPI